MSLGIAVISVGYGYVEHQNRKRAYTAAAEVQRSLVAFKTKENLTDRQRAGINDQLERLKPFL